jgi:hypothetical protein
MQAVVVAPVVLDKMLVPHQLQLVEVMVVLDYKFLQHSAIHYLHQAILQHHNHIKEVVDWEHLVLVDLFILRAVEVVPVREVLQQMAQAVPVVVEKVELLPALQTF